MAEGDEFSEAKGQDMSVEQTESLPTASTSRPESMSGAVEDTLVEPTPMNDVVEPSNPVAAVEETPIELAAAASVTPSAPAVKPQRLAFTLDIQEGKLDEYMEHHAKNRPEVVDALRSVGIRNLSLWAWQNRLFYYAEYVGTMPFAEAMDEYAKKPGVKEWEELMHGYQAAIPGTDPDSDVWWQPCSQVYFQS